MGRIPEYRRQALAKAPKGAPAPDRSGEIIASAVARAGTEIGQALEQMSAKKDSLAANNSLLEFKRDYYKQQREIKAQNLNNPEQALAEINAMGETLQMQYEDTLGTDRSKAMFSDQSTRMLSADTDNLSGWAFNQNVNIMRNDYHSSTGLAATEVSETNTYEGYEQSKQQLKDIIEVNGEGLETKKSRDARYKTMLKTATNTHLTNRAYKDPTSLIKDLQDGRYDKDYFGGDIKARDRYVREVSTLAVDMRTKEEDLASINGITNAIELMAYLESGAIAPSDFMASIDVMRSNEAAPKGQVEMMEKMFTAYVKDRGTAVDDAQAAGLWQEFMAYAQKNSDDKKSQAVKLIKMLGDAAGMYQDGTMSKKTYDSVRRTFFSGASTRDIKKYGDKSRTDLSAPGIFSSRGFKNLYEDDIYARTLIDTDTVIDKDTSIPETQKTQLKLNVFQQLVPAITRYLQDTNTDPEKLTSRQMDIITRKLVLGETPEGQMDPTSIGILINEKRKLSGRTIDIADVGGRKVMGMLTTGELITEPIGDVKEGLDND